jgi:hypothetical protein
MNGATHTDASGNSPRQNRIMPKVPILSRTPTSSVAVPGVDCRGGVRQPGVQRHHGRLDDEGDQEAEHQPAAQIAVDAERGKVADEVGRRPLAAETANKPTTEASMIRPPARLNSRNLMAA